MVKIDVITYCSGYDYKVFERFVGSLNDTGFSGKIHIIVNEFDKPVILRLKAKYKNVYPVKDNLLKTTHINCHRFFCIDVLLSKLKLDCDYLLLCDSRDVLFQKNIEEYPYDKDVDIYGFLEGITFEKEQVFNAPWIKMIEQLVNEKIYDKLCSNQVICCGTTIGKNNAIIHYVKMMCYYIKTYNIVYNLDQGLHNYMLYLNKLGCNIKLLSNIDNLVNTVGNDVHKINDNKLIVNKNDELSWIVHQYDRFSKENRATISIKYDYTC
jgi:hypothetical protein